MAKATALDLMIARNIKAIRNDAKLTQPQVASHLGISYQSYQKMEAGKVSFRASTLDLLAALYNKKLFEILRGGEMDIDPAITKATLILHGMSDDDRDEAIRCLLNIKHKATV